MSWLKEHSHDLSVISRSPELPFKTDTVSKMETIYILVNMAVSLPCLC